MNVLLNDNEVRVLGALVEKESTTPDYYPLSLNALTNACNQKSNRDPVMSLSEGEVTEALEGLRDKRLAREVSSFDSRVPKYAHQLADAFNFDRREIAVLGVLLLRGPADLRRQPICVRRHQHRATFHSRTSSRLASKPLPRTSPTRGCRRANC